MTQKTLELYYDNEADILEIFIGEPSPSYFDEIEDDIFEAHDEITGELKGYKIFSFLKRGGFKKVRGIKISLPAGVDIKSI
ncbi:MAG: hypothetical protein Q7S56_02650 [Nanoarchaeota archaeon]|nr:hypothetical protein [Nanoarchaeota archaeon]